jgi:replicative DNA helicase
MTKKKQDEKQRIENQRREEINEFEQCLLGSLLLKTHEGIPQLKIQSHYFSNPLNGLIFQIFFKQLKNRIKPDILTLATDPELREVGAAYISSLTNKIPSAANLEFYEDEILKAWQTRTAKKAIERFNERTEAADYQGDIENVLREFTGILSGALSDKHADCFTTFDQYINRQAKKEYWREYTPKLFGSLSFPDGTISAIGAAPGGGKSAALINLCRELLTTAPIDNPNPKESEKAQNIDAQRKILYISTEMSTEDLTDRLIHSLAWYEVNEGQPFYLESVKRTNQDFWKLLKYKYGTPPDYWEFSQDEQQRADLYQSVIEKYIRPAWGDRLKIAYVFGKAKYFDDICNIILNNADPGTLVLLDYLQQMPICSADVGQRNPRYLEIRHIMDMGKITAEKTQSVIIAAGQLSREDRKAGNKGDDTQGWRESGDIEQTAWNLIKMTRENEKLSYRITKARSSAGVGTGYSLKWMPSYQYMAYGGKLAAPKKAASKKKGNNTENIEPEETKGTESNFDWSTV